MRVNSANRAEIVAHYRTNSSLAKVYIGNGRLSARTARYGPYDAHCCPSQSDLTTYVLSNTSDVELTQVAEHTDTLKSNDASGASTVDQAQDSSSVTVPAAPLQSSVTTPSTVSTFSPSRLPGNVTIVEGSGKTIDCPHILRAQRGHRETDELYANVQDYCDAIIRTLNHQSYDVVLANRILRAVGEDIGVIGRGGPSEIVTTPITNPDAIIARTNGTLIGEAWTAVQARARIHLVGRDTIIPRARAAAMLHVYGRADHAALRRFAFWNVLREVAERPLGRTYKPFVDLAIEHGGALPSILDQIDLAHTEDEMAADVTLTSAHRFEGDEADRVPIANDFEPFISLNKYGRPEIDHEKPISPTSLATRAKRCLDASSFLSVVDGSIEVLGEEEGPRRPSVIHPAR